MKIYALIECLDKDDYEENLPEAIFHGVYSSLKKAANAGLELVRERWEAYESDESNISVELVTQEGSLVAIVKDIECERFHIIETEIEGERVLKRDKDGRPIVGAYPWES